MIRAEVDGSFASFRELARRLLAADVSPARVAWDGGAGQGDLFAASASEPVPQAPARTVRVPAAFVTVAEIAAHHADPGRWELLYRVAYRLTHGAPELLDAAADPDVHRLRGLVQAVRHDEHRMHAFLRFRPLPAEPDGRERMVAFYEPEHDVLPIAAPFFARRFAALAWVIVTPTREAVWDGARLEIGPRHAPTPLPVPAEDELDELFRAYYGAIFNPARANGALFAQHVPARFRERMPEVARAAALLREAPVETGRLVGRVSSASAAYLPRLTGEPGADHAALAAAARACAACPIGAQATQAVFGEGPLAATLALVGEQPGDQEDLAGRPFVGPAGAVLDRALLAAGVARDRVYVTNAVKHFKWEPRGKRRLHARPSPVEVHACRGFLDAELRLVAPRLVVCLGATAARALLGRNLRLSDVRGRVVDGAPWAARLVVTHHPSAILRAPDAIASAELEAELVRDLALAASAA